MVKRRLEVRRELFVRSNERREVLFFAVGVFLVLEVLEFGFLDLLSAGVCRGDFGIYIVSFLEWLFFFIFVF